ncbi:WD40-repeat-containing domain protein [Mycena belliarum]|uniref:WD40-repeat-containing domain protein n=1 Tax=Mycena belliarum TaxID=1033014 RepID=A0AAD6XFY1_9AGAR|nr:WD40-repeat-containing domain protein [Mycena belliae]
MFFSQKSPTHYVPLGQLRGHSGGIVRLRATEDGKLLASGGTDGTKIWNLSTMAMVATPKSSQIRKATTALVWIKRGDDLSETLFYGTAQGYLVCWEKAEKDQARTILREISCVRIVNPAEISDLAFNAPSNRLAVCHRGGVVQVYTLGSNMILQQVFSLGLKDFVPRAIVFGEMTGNEKDIMVFGLYSGDIYTFRGSKGNVNGASWNVGGLIGDAALHLEGGALCMDEPSTGVNIYRLDRRELVKSFPVKVTKPAMRSRQVAFVDEHKKEYKSVVSGSDHGMVYVFDRRSGDVEVLKVHADDWVQTVAVSVFILIVGGAERTNSGC